MQLFPSNRTPEYLMKYADFAVRYLGLDKLRGDINLYVVPEVKDCHGICYGDARECDIFIANKLFGESVSREDKMKTLGHELTHARQFLRRDLGEDVKEGEAMWLGKPYKYEPGYEDDSPWELEAVKYENLIWNSWKWMYGKYK